MTRSSHWRHEASRPFQLLQNELNRFLAGYLQPGPFGGSEPAPTDTRSDGVEPGGRRLRDAR